MEKKNYLTPAISLQRMTFDFIMQNEISNVESEDDGPGYGGGGHGDGNAKEHDPWQDGLWAEDGDAQQETITKSLW